ncbi:hypothetical protein TNCV_3070071 [Trichonephila clavipes]|nr:hypothetical protein TNCV_3070071 [Trichonephila clavipes]
MAIGENKWTGRCGLSWLLPDALEVKNFIWERAGWLLSDWMLKEEDNDSDWLPKGFKKLQKGKWEIFVQLGNRI